jgi:hypothetical protein
MKLRLSGSSKAISEPLKSGMPSKLSAKTTSDARPQSISSTSSTKPKIASVPLRVFHAMSEAPRVGRSPRSSARLTWYRPRHSKGPISRKPADKPSV